MKAVKRTVMIAVSAVLFACLFISGTVKAETEGDYEYELQSDGTVIITNYTGADTEVTVPDSLNGHTVTSIGGSAFYNCSSLTSITIPEGVTSIGPRAFQNCSSLTSITLPEGVTSIGQSAFANCRNLQSVTIPGSVQSIASDTLYYSPKCSVYTVPGSYASRYYGSRVRYLYEEEESGSVFRDYQE